MSKRDNLKLTLLSNKPLHKSDFIFCENRYLYVLTFKLFVKNSGYWENQKHSTFKANQHAYSKKRLIT